MPTLYDNFERVKDYIQENNTSYVSKTELVEASYVTNPALVSMSYISEPSARDLFPTYTYLMDYLEEHIKAPEVIWEVAEGSAGLIGLNTNMTSGFNNWQLTGLDMSPYNYIKIYAKSAQKSGATASASTTTAMVLEMSLDERAAGPYGGHYIGSTISQKPNDNNRLATLTCAVSADKTSFAVIRMTSLYGTAATSNSDVNAYVFKIVGFYDKCSGAGSSEVTFSYLGANYLSLDGGTINGNLNINGTAYSSNLYSYIDGNLTDICSYISNINTNLGTAISLTDAILGI